MTHTVYILEGNQLLYVGMTGNLAKRLATHRKGGCKSSRESVGPRFKLLHTWKKLTYLQASKLERWLHKQHNQAIRQLLQHHSNYDNWLMEVTLALETTEWEEARQTQLDRDLEMELMDASWHRTSGVNHVSTDTDLCSSDHSFYYSDLHFSSNLISNC